MGVENIFGFIDELGRLIFYLDEEIAIINPSFELFRAMFQSYTQDIQLKWLKGILYSLIAQTPWKTSIFESERTKARLMYDKPSEIEKLVDKLWEQYNITNVTDEVLLKVYNTLESLAADLVNDKDFIWYD